MRRFVVAFSLAPLFGLLMLGIASCGGHSNAKAVSRGRVTLTVNWPSSREIPSATRSIKIVAFSLGPDQGIQVGEVVVQRPANQPTSQVVLEDLPSVKVRLTATAHASTDGTGDVLAQGSKDVDVPENSTVPASISLQAQSEQVLELSNVTDGEVQGPCGHFTIEAELDGDPAPPVTWTQSRGTFLVESSNSMRFLVPNGSGPVTITAKLVSDPTITASATVIVDNLIGIYDTNILGRIRFFRPNEGTEMHPWEGGTVTHSGSSFSGTFNTTGTITGTVGDTTISGTGVIGNETFTFTGTRVCPEWPP